MPWNPFGTPRVYLMLTEGKKSGIHTQSFHKAETWWRGTVGRPFLLRNWLLCFQKTADLSYTHLRTLLSQTQTYSFVYFLFSSLAMRKLLWFYRMWVCIYESVSVCVSTVCVCVAVGKRVERHSLCPAFTSLDFKHPIGSQDCFSHYSTCDSHYTQHIAHYTHTYSHTASHKPTHPYSHAQSAHARLYNTNIHRIYTHALHLQRHR